MSGSLLQEDLQYNETNQVFIHSQLKKIQKTLKAHYDSLVLREEEITRRETLLCQQVKSMEDMVCSLEERERELDEREKKLNLLEKENVTSDSDKLSHEHHRLRKNFAVLKESRNEMKQQINEMSTKNDELVSQVSLLRGRLASLKMTQKITSTSNQTKPNNAISSPESIKKLPKTKPIVSLHPTIHYQLTDLMVLVMHWLTKAQLYIIKHHSDTDAIMSDTAAISLRAVPLLTIAGQLIMESDIVNNKLTYLEFGHLVVGMIDRNHVAVLPAASLRRMGEVCLCYVGKSLECISCTILSYLIILQTINQVDKVISTLEGIESLIEDEKTQGIFIMYQGISTIFKLLTTDGPLLVYNRCLMILLKLATNPRFILKFANHQCISDLIALLKRTKEIDVLEKLTIILQRISKCRDAHVVLHNCDGVRVIEKTILDHQSDSFIRLNLKSVLTNIKI